MFAATPLLLCRQLVVTEDNRTPVVRMETKRSYLHWQTNNSVYRNKVRVETRTRRSTTRTTTRTRTTTTTAAATTTTTTKSKSQLVPKDSLAIKKFVLIFNF